MKWIRKRGWEGIPHKLSYLPNCKRRVSQFSVPKSHALCGRREAAQVSTMSHASLIPMHNSSYTHRHILSLSFSRTHTHTQVAHPQHQPGLQLECKFRRTHLKLPWLGLCGGYPRASVLSPKNAGRVGRGCGGEYQMHCALQGHVLIQVHWLFPKGDKTQKLNYSTCLQTFIQVFKNLFPNHLLVLTETNTI